MTEAMTNLAIDACLLVIMGGIPVVIGVSLGMLHNWLIPKRT